MESRIVCIRENSLFSNGEHRRRVEEVEFGTLLSGCGMVIDMVMVVMVVMVIMVMIMMITMMMMMMMMMVDVFSTSLDQSSVNSAAESWTSN
jgi:hypothetical protein